MKLQYLKSWALSELYQVVQSAPGKYANDSSWVQSHFTDRAFLADSRIEVADLPELQLPTSDTDLFETENAIALHGALRTLNRNQAADDRLWAWLAHGPYWTYMRKRWSIESQKNKIRYVREHYFIGDSRSLVRHGLARLWWFGHATYVPGEPDPYSLTRLLLKTTDARQQIMERQFWRNQDILHPFLKRIGHWVDEGKDLYAPRERFRDLCKMMNLAGGSTILDTLPATAIGEIVDGFAGDAVLR
jgi:hypothetical protein